MNFNAYIEENMDEDMLPYTCSAEYQTSRQEIIMKIAAFKDSLTSKAQQEAFLQLIDLINTADADFAVNAHFYGFMSGMKFQDKELER